MKSKIDSVYLKHEGNRIYQGDIIRDFVHFEWFFKEGKKIFIKRKKIPYLIILTQDCDLEWDFNNHNDSESKNQDKFLQSILVCPAYLAEKFRNGEHLKNLVMEKIGSDRWSNILNNQNPRYHFLPNNKALQIPNLVIDFKHYYSIPRDIIYKEVKDHYIGTINELFREALSQRFAYYLSRIGLPFIKNNEESDANTPQESE